MALVAASCIVRLSHFEEDGALVVACREVVMVKPQGEVLPNIYKDRNNPFPKFLFSEHLLPGHGLCGENLQ